MKDRIINLLIIIACLARFLAFGKANKLANRLNSILVIQMAKLGDMVCTTPMFRAIKDKYPNCEVWVLGNDANKELLNYNKDIDGYIVYSQNTKEVINLIKEKKFNFACVTGPNFAALATLVLSGIKLIAAPRIENGISPYETISYKILSKFVTTKPHHMGSYAPREYLRLLEPIGIFTDDTKKHLAFPKNAEQRAEEILKPFAGKFIIGIAPAAGNKIKEWPTKRFAEVANYAAQKHNAVIVIIGGGNDLGYAEKMKKCLLVDASIIDTAGKLSIDELKALISKLNLFISVDTGPIYIAEALNIPTINITGPIDEREQPPMGQLHLVVTPPSREKPELFVMNARVYNTKEARRQIDSITADMVKDELDVLIDLVNKNNK
mgnify:FL=1